VKRYTHPVHPDESEFESTDGEWVRFDDAGREIAKLQAVVDALPRCSHPHCQPSPKHATWLTFDGWTCDEHEHTAPDYDRQEIPYAGALRALAKD
jgi:hypothetical protein